MRKSAWLTAAAALVCALGSVVGVAHAGAATTGSISGVVRAQATRAPIAGAWVGAYEPFDAFPDASATTAADGSYHLTGLAAGPYVVCVDATQGTLSDPSGLGYQSRCYRNAAWVPDPDQPPSGTQVTVAAGQDTPAVGIALLPAAAIAGRVLDLDGRPVAGVTAEVFSNPPSTQGRTVGSATTAANGTYRVSELPPARSGYYVCFDTFSARGASPAGYLDQCYSDRAWGGAIGPFPAGMKLLVVHAGQSTRGVDAHLRPAAGITGQVVDARDGSPIKGAVVSLVAPNGNTYTGSYTDASGRYTITRLPPAEGSVQVCFSGDQFIDYANAATGYGGVCNRDVPWDGGTAPAGPTPTPIHAGGLTTVNGRLRPGGRLVGTVITTGGQPVSGGVDFYRPDGQFVGLSLLDGAGHFVKPGLTPGLPYVVCAYGAGRQGQCYRELAWNVGDEPPSSATPFVFTSGQTRKQKFVLSPAQ